MSILFPLNFPSPSIWEICMLLCSLKCALTQATANAIYQVPSTICLRQAGRKAVVVTPYYIYNNEREKRKNEKSKKSNY